VIGGVLGGVGSRVGAPTDPELDRALAVLGWRVDSADVLAFSWALWGGGVALAAALALAPLGTVVPAATLAVAVVAGYTARAFPGWLGEARRVRALGAGPDLIALAVLRARVDPTPERAAEFAAEHARDPLAASLREHATRTRGAPGSGWEGFADTWRDRDPALGRAVALLEAGFEADAADRDRLFERALGAALSGIRQRVAAFAAAMRGPTTAIYAFGVVLPLALVATLPAARSAGVPVPLGGVVAVYDVLLPGTLLAASAWILGRQPAAFPPAAVSVDHPDVPDRRHIAGLAGLLAGALAWVGAPVLLPDWTRWIVAPGWAAGLAVAIHFRGVAQLRESVTAIERGLPDALSVAGQHLNRGAAVEAAVAAAGRELAGPTAQRFAAAARLQRRLGVGTERAFLGPTGAFSDLPSPRARAAVSILSLAGREGPHGGRVLIELADHLEDLLAVERDAARTLAGTAGTLRSTAWCFGPLVGGVTVALAGRLGSLDGGPVTAVRVDGLGIAIGVYVLLLAAVLAGLAAALDRGPDRARIGYQAGVAVVAAGSVFGVTVGAASVLL
jgi:Flp pilus assembly protein TadB